MQRKTKLHRAGFLNAKETMRMNGVSSMLCKLQR